MADQANQSVTAVPTEESVKNDAAEAEDIYHDPRFMEIFEEIKANWLKVDPDFYASQGSEEKAGFTLQADAEREFRRRYLAAALKYDEKKVQG